MFQSLRDELPNDPDYPERQHRLDALTRVLDGRIYDHMEYSFDQEENGAGEYIKLRERRPSVQYNLAKIVVDSSVSLLFSEGHFPEIECGDENTRKALAAIIKDAKINQRMVEAATVGSVGSVCLWMRVLKGRVFVEVLPTLYLTPVFDPESPDDLQSVTEQYKVKGEQLKAVGYDIADDDLGADHWFMRQWDAVSETSFVPWLVDEDEGHTPQIDESNSVKHDFGFVPMVWIQNLPGIDPVDGPCTFEPAINTSIEIDYQLSQAGRGLKYSSDPMLMIKEPAMGGEEPRGGGNTLKIDATGDAKLLEINGTASEAVIEYVRHLRELALESVHGNRANADKLSAAQSGRAMELMNQALIWLADRLRITYGEGGLLDLLRMIMAASERFDLRTKYAELPNIDPNAEISLRWAPWYAPTQSDKQTQAETLRTLKDARLMSQNTAVSTLAPDYDIEEVKKEIQEIEADVAKEPVPSQVQEKISVSQ